MQNQEKQFGIMNFALLRTLEAQGEVLKLIETNSPSAGIASQMLLLFVRVCIVLKRSPSMALDLTLQTRAAYFQRNGEIERVIKIARERIALCDQENKFEQVLPKMYLTENLISAGHFNEAATLIDDTTNFLEPYADTRAPDFMEVLRVKALYKETLFQWDEAYGLLQELLKCSKVSENKRCPLYKLKLVNLCIKLRRTEEAEEILSELFETSENLHPALYATAALHYACADDLQKAAFYGDVVKTLLTPTMPGKDMRIDFPAYWFARAVLEYKKKNFETSELLLRALIASRSKSGQTEHPTLLIFLPYLQDILQKLGRAEESEQVTLQINRIKTRYSITRNLTP